MIRRVSIVVPPSTGDSIYRDHFPLIPRILQGYNNLDEVILIKSRFPSFPSAMLLSNNFVTSSSGRSTSL
jgi:hypothetical protein